ncbi:MAG: lipid carrier--UDP-N-acetylgalactosaminyltransferase [Flavobacteriaceae bacterium CG_4_9_14_3_um_filter_33_16]|nr:MAG: lipid carrier--UDP-N-acetylgalactosaminyltransferase [Flavobacteriaceae bacterium CG_4_9_14_3_um_filter_33_16]
MYKKIIKRLLDFMLAFFGLILTLPISISIAIILLLSNRGTPFFFQRRPGKDEKIFRIVKFKTMNDRKDIHGKLLPDKERLTAIGKFVRKYSLDELPQLINVLIGDMALIGPRPLIVEYLTVYNENQKKRHLVRPGITGWAQVNGRNSISWKKKFELDVWYVEHLSFLLDLKIFGMTILNVLQKKDVNLSNDLTSEYFNGTN